MGEKVKREFGKSGYQILPVIKDNTIGAVVEVHTMSMSAALVMDVEEVRQYIKDLQGVIDDAAT